MGREEISYSSAWPSSRDLTPIVAQVVPARRCHRSFPRGSFPRIYILVDGCLVLRDVVPNVQPYSGVSTSLKTLPGIPKSQTPAPTPWNSFLGLLPMFSQISLRLPTSCSPEVRCPEVRCPGLLRARLKSKATSVVIWSATSVQ